MIAMLAAIVVGGLVVALMSTSMASQQRVRDNRDYQHAINGADAGVQQALAAVSDLDASDLSTEHLSSDGTVGEVEFEWEADRATPYSWEVRSVGELNDTVRTVEATVERESIFFTAAFADKEVLFRGGNSATSYPPSGLGAVGSNGMITMNGNAEADMYMLMGSGADCDGCEADRITGNPDPFDMDAVVDQIENDMEDACSEGFQPFDTEAGSPDLVPGETYCFDLFRVGKNTTLDIAGASAEDPVKIYMDAGAEFNVEHHASVNCHGATWTTCTDGDEPEAASLQIYTLGTNVGIANQSEIAASIAAPNSDCGEANSNAQAEIYGSLLCNDLANQGGWSFHYDVRLMDVGSGSYGVANWREEVGGTSLSEE